MEKLKTGDKAPMFELNDQNGKSVSLKQFKGKKALVYFYPKADTPGCTRQACSVRDSLNELKKHGVHPLGISPDTVTKQAKFNEKYNLGFPLLSDTEHETAKNYGAYGEKSMYGKKVMGIIRSAFLIDENSKIMGAWYKVKPEDTVPLGIDLLKGEK